MEKKVTNCNECPLSILEDESGKFYCIHPDAIGWYELSDLSVIHPSCPEGQPFVIITSKIKEDE